MSSEAAMMAMTGGSGGEMEWKDEGRPGGRRG